ncbi:hypothetical protein [Streptomyces tirandamycinicus]|uniref:hypothetical protein n=1 Tax=Streptomyces tirandamycinicus TaxID=2174846 RepID=UPI00142D8570|nr:hypothetical protein [Streptomyces tirandamycinicus]
MRLTEQERQRAEDVLHRNVTNWHPAGSLLILDRLDRLVGLAEKLLEQHGTDIE